MCNEDGYNVACALVQPRVSDEGGRNPRAESAPDNNEHKPSQTLIS
jgi:hypothetical protein